MTNLRASAAYRIAFTYSASFAVATATLGAAVYIVSGSEFRQQRDAAIAAESADLAQTLRTDGWRELAEVIRTREAAGRAGSFSYAIFDNAGRNLVGGLDTSRPAAGWSDIVFLEPDGGPDPARAFSRALPKGRLLVVATDSEPLERIDRTILTLFGFALLAIATLGVVGAMILGNYLRGRLERLSGAAQAIVGGDLDRRMPVGRRGDEFDALSVALNAMLERIAQLVQNLQQVSSDVAHDLRTPLTRLRASLETALADPSDREPLEDAIRQSDALLSLFSAILRISEVEGGSVKNQLAVVDVSALVRDLGETYGPAITDGGRTLVCRIDDGLFAAGDPELLSQAIINLLDNAQIHTPAGSTITLSVNADDANVGVHVADDGEGVAEADRARITRRFVRLAASRSTRGNGLGLNLVSAIVTAVGGTLRIEDARPGLELTILLPRLNR